MFRRDTKKQEYACLGEIQKNKRKGLGYISLYKHQARAYKDIETH